MMQERRTNGDDVLTGRVSPEDFLQALEDERNRFVAMHREGSQVTTNKGRTYETNALGQWVRVGKKRNAERAT